MTTIAHRPDRGEPAPTPPDSTDPTDGDARTERERRVRERFPLIGGLGATLGPPPQTTTAWPQGAVGELTVAAALARPADEGTIVVLHGRRLPGSKAPIDHVAVGPRGVYVVDTKRYAGKRIERRVGESLYAEEAITLAVGGRDRTHLVDGLHHHVAAVQEAVDDLGALTPIAAYPTLCFVDGRWAERSHAFEIDGTHVTAPRGLVRHVSRPGDLTADERLVIAHHLARSLPAA
jgi:hypothetical protein